VLSGHLYSQKRDEWVVNTGRFTIDPAANPCHFDVILEGEGGSFHVIPGIYRLDGDNLTICLGNQRPDEFDSAVGKSQALWVYSKCAAAHLLYYVQAAEMCSK
jgi:hypothetical protein